MSINVINHMICKWGGGNISYGYEVIWPLHSSVPTQKKIHEKNGIRDAGVAPRILSVGTSCRWMVLEVILGVVIGVV